MRPRTHAVVPLALGLALAITATPSLGQGCQIWSSRFGPDPLGFNGPVRALRVFDDGGGPRLYVAGGFTAAGRVLGRGPVRWDHDTFHPLGAGLPDVRALEVFDPDGPGPLPPSLYAGGNFPGGVARWTGDAWEIVGAGIGTGVACLAAWHDGVRPVLVAAGSFEVAGGVPTKRVAAWHPGSAWRQMGQGLESPAAPGSSAFASVSALLVTDLDGLGPQGPTLLAAGEFTRSGPTPLRGMARYDGGAWQHGLVSLSRAQSTVGQVTMLDIGTPEAPALLIAGEFDRVNGRPSNGVFAWTGEVLQLGPPTPALLPPALAWHDDGTGPTAYIAVPPGVMGDRAAVARWTGDAWDPVSGTGFTAVPVVLAPWVHDNTPTLFAAGNFSNVDGRPARGLTMLGPWCGPTRIVLQPADVTASAGEGVVFETVLEGQGPFQFQWRRGGVALMDSGTVTGSRTPVLRLTSGEAIPGFYDCVVIGPQGSLVTRRAELRVIDPTGASAPLPLDVLVASTDRMRGVTQAGSLDGLMAGLDGSIAVRGATDSQLIVRQSGFVRPIVWHGLGAPGLPGASRFVGLGSVAAPPVDRGWFLFNAFAGPTAAGAHTLWAFHGAGPRIVAGLGLPAFGLNHRLTWASLAGLGLDQAGHAYFAAVLSDGRALVGRWDLFNELIRPLLRTGDPAPQLAGTITGVPAGVATAHGQVLGWARVTRTAPPWLTGLALWSLAGSEPRLLWGPGFTPPGLPAGMEPASAPAISTTAGGAVVFTGQFSMPGGGATHAAVRVDAAGSGSVLLQPGVPVAGGPADLRVERPLLVVTNDAGDAIGRAILRSSSFSEQTRSAIIARGPGEPWRALMIHRQPLAAAGGARADNPGALGLNRRGDAVFEATVVRSQSGEPGVFGWHRRAGTFPILMNTQHAREREQRGVLVRRARLPQSSWLDIAGWSSAPSDTGSVVSLVEFMGASSNVVAAADFDRALANVRRCPLMLEEPSSASPSAGTRLELRTRPVGLEPMILRWYREGVPLGDAGPVRGSGSATLVIDPVGLEHAGQYTLWASNACGSGSTWPIRVEVLCPGDWDRSGVIDENDLLAFLNAFNERHPDADLTRDGTVDFNDLLAMLDAMQGC